MLSVWDVVYTFRMCWGCVGDVLGMCWGCVGDVWAIPGVVNTFVFLNVFCFFSK